MPISCKHCSATNESTNIFCKDCNQPLWSESEAVRKLEEKQKSLEKRFYDDIMQLRTDIKLVKSIQLKNVKVPQATKPQTSSIQKENIEKVQVRAPREPIVRKVRVPRQPSALDLRIQSFLSPVHEGIALFNKTYNKYKVEGKLPIFFMTISGITAILFGIGFLMQQSFQHMGAFAPVVKISLGFTASVGITLFGWKLYNRETKYHEYASSLLGLGIVLNYLLIYFLSDLGHFPLLSSSILGFSLIILNTIWATLIALKYETRIIAVLSLLGGALAPFFLNATESSTAYYLYLWVLTSASCYVAHKIGWKNLTKLAFVTAMGILELSLFNDSPQTIIFTIYYHLFAYLFFYLILFKGNKFVKSLERIDIVLLATNISLLLANLYGAHSSNLLLLGFLFIGNAVLFSLLLIKKWREVSPTIKFVNLIIIGSLLGFAIPSLFNQSLMGLFWSIEAFLLILLGFNFKITRVRKEGYGLLLIALGKLLYSARLIVVNWNTSLIHAGYFNFLIVGLVITALGFVFYKNRFSLTLFEIKLLRFAKEILPVWFSLVFFVTGYFMFLEWVFVGSFVPMFLLIYWSNLLKTQLSAIIGISHLILYLMAFLISVNQTGSSRFGQQFLYAQISVVEMYLSFWFIKYFFISTNMKSHWTFSVAQNLRILFFSLIPLIFIQQINRHLHDYLASAIWFALAIAYLLYRRLKYRALIFEIYLLATIALGINFYLGDIQIWEGLAAIVILITISVLEKAHKVTHLNDSVFKPIITVSPFIGFAVLGYISTFGEFENIAYGFAIYPLLLLLATMFSNQIAVFNSIKKVSNILVVLSLGIALFGGLFTQELGVLPIIATCLILLGIQLRNKKSWFDLPKDNMNWLVILVLHQLLLIGFYAEFLELTGLTASGPFFSILLVIHAITLLFLALKYEIKLLNKVSIVLFLSALLKVVIHDIRDFGSTEKVIVFIILGIVLLGASFLYVKLKDRFEKKEITTANTVQNA